MTPPDGKKNGAMPPDDLARLAQRDIGKVARLFRDSGFRYRVFDSETGEHQLVDPVRPLPPMDHVPPVWPPPFSEDELPPPQRAAVEPVVAPVVIPLRNAVTPPAAVAPVLESVAPPMPRVDREPGTSPGAIRAEAKTDEIFRAAALESAVSAVQRAAPAATPAPSPKPSVLEEEDPMSSNRTTAQPSAARQVARLVAMPSKHEPKPSDDAAAPAVEPTDRRLFRVGGSTVAAVFEKLLSPPLPSPRPEPHSTGAVLRDLIGPRTDK